MSGRKVRSCSADLPGCCSSRGTRRSRSRSRPADWMRNSIPTTTTCSTAAPGSGQLRQPHAGRSVRPRVPRAYRPADRDPQRRPQPGRPDPQGPGRPRHRPGRPGPPAPRSIRALRAGVRAERRYIPRHQRGVPGAARGRAGPIARHRRQGARRGPRRARPARPGADYWLLATLGEAYLLLGDETAARGRYAQAVHLARDEHDDGDIASMLRQLRLLREHLPIGDDLLGLFHLGPWSCSRDTPSTGPASRSASPPTPPSRPPSASPSSTSWMPGGEHRLL